MGYFGESTKRIAKIRETLLNTQPAICVERAVYTTQAYQENLAKRPILKRALAFDKTLRNMSIYIEEGTLIVGNQASGNRYAPIFPEYAMDWVVDELDALEKRDGDMFLISGESKRILREMAPFWEGKTLKEKALALMPPMSRTLYDAGVIRCEGNITAGDAHLAVSYETLLTRGMLAVREDAEKAKAKLDLSNFSDLKKLYFYDAVLISLDACIAFAERYSELALQMAEKEADPARREELLEIARICKKVPAYPADTFHEALQSVWFLHLLLQVESSGHSLSFGRFDQFMYPAFRADMEAGMLTEEQATELLENFWLKTFTINKVRSASHTKYSAGSPLYQNVCIGGQTTDGKDAVNRLSFLVLRSVARLRLPQPNLSVRYHSGTSDAFMKDCIEVIRLGFGMPSFNNDETTIDSFIKWGISKEDAYNYSSIGCIEVSIPGKYGYRTSGMNFLNFPRILMAGLNNGVDVTSGKRICKDMGHLRDMASFDQVWKVWEEVVKIFTKESVIMDNCADFSLEEETPDPLCSAFVADCIGRGLTLKEGGAIYDNIGPLQVGIANTGDSLAVLKKLVFDEKRITPSQLWDAMMENYSGSEGERIHSIVLNEAPKFGNDIDYVDHLTADSYQVYINEIAKYHNTRYGRGPINCGYYAGTSSISANVPQGAGVCATPDGRYKGEPLAEGCSPSHGADTHGPTAVFKSISKLPTPELLGGVLLNQKLNPSSLVEERDKQKLILLLRTFFDTLKGYHVQYNVVSRDMLLDAQKNPEKHRDLIVRVAGYSAFFNVLSRETQDDIIGRTEHVL